MGFWAHVKGKAREGKRQGKGREGEGEGLLQKRSIFLAFDLGAHLAKDFFYQPEPHLEEKYGKLLVVALPHLKSWPISNQRESRGRGRGRAVAKEVHISCI